MIAAQGFDASVWDIWPNLIAGATVVVCDEDTRHDPDAVTAWLIDNHIDVAFLATPLAEAVLGTERVGELPLRAILTGGDALRQRPRPGLGVTVYNHYGPTETTVIVTHGTVADSDTDRVITIGVPTDNAELYLLDERGRLAPRGIGGELYIGGVQVARGYLDRPDLNRERFVPSPFTSGGRLYRTGDLARWRNNGELEFLGRADRQIKVRGFRIEPGEIETRLRAHPAVADAFVIADGVDANRRRLVAYLAPAPAAAVPDATELRALLRGQLPDYMVPAQFVAVGALPMSPNGKVDRLRLPAPPAESAPEAEPVEPRDEVERAVAAVFAAVLERERVGVHDNFFELGGHSLRAGRLAAALRRDFNIDLPMKAVFAGPTVAEIAVALVETALAGAA
jgi:acyl-coenzyme A synthetase/AMP-(fatty) acid ligase